jgi:hypothetical protein
LIFERTIKIGNTTSKNLGTDKRRAVVKGIKSAAIVYTASGGFKNLTTLMPIPKPKIVNSKSEKIVKLSGLTPLFVI